MSTQADGPFPYFDVTPVTVEAAADDITATGGTVESTAETVDVTHTPARLSVQGLLTGPMASAPEPMRANMAQAMQAACSAAAAEVLVTRRSWRSYEGSRPNSC